MVCVKGNQTGLRDAVADVFERAGEAAFADCDERARRITSLTVELSSGLVHSPRGCSDERAC